MDCGTTRLYGRKAVGESSACWRKLKFKGLEGLVGLRMRHLVILLVHLITAVLRLVRPGGVRAVVAESVLAKHQLLIFDRSRRRAPNLTLWIG